MMSSITLMSHDLSQPIRLGEKQDTQISATEGPHSVGVWTLEKGYNLVSPSYIVGKLNLCRAMFN